MSSATIVIQAEARVALRTIAKVITKLTSEFKGEKFTVYKVVYKEELDMLRLDMRGSTVCD